MLIINCRFAFYYDIDYIMWSFHFGSCRTFCQKHTGSARWDQRAWTWWWWLEEMRMPIRSSVFIAGTWRLRNWSLRKQEVSSWTWMVSPFISVHEFLESKIRTEWNTVSGDYWFRFWYTSLKQHLKLGNCCPLWCETVFVLTLFYSLKILVNGVDPNMERFWIRFLLLDISDYPSRVSRLFIRIPEFIGGFCRGPWQCVPIRSHSSTVEEAFLNCKWCQI